MYGGTGFLGPRIVALLEKGGEEYVMTKCRLQNREAVEKELDEVKPTKVLNIGLCVFFCFLFSFCFVLFCLFCCCCGLSFSFCLLIPQNSWNHRSPQRRLV